MSLRLWLPLNGDLINKGLEPGIKVTNNQSLVTFVNDGKLGGQCAVFNGNKQCVLKTNYKANFSTGNFSIAFWLKIDSASAEISTTYPYLICSRGYTASAQGFAIIYSKSSNKIGLRVANGSNNSWQNIDLDISQYFDKWIHIIAIKDNNLTKHGCFYINGQKYDLAGTLTSYDIGNNDVWIGEDKNNNYVPLLMQMQDVRIYDHALSDKEAKELAKGLVLHYKLDNNGYGNPNLITNEILHSSPWSNTITNYNTIYNNKNCMRLTSSGLYTYTSKNTTSIFPTITFKENTAYTLSLDWVDIRTDGKNSSMFLAFYYSDGTSSRITVPASSKTEWTHAVLTTSTGKTVTRMGSSYGNSGNYICIANLKLEESPVETKYSPSIDNLSTEIKDVSGYGNDGIIIGTPTVTTDTLKYDFSTVFNGSNTAIKVVNNKWMSQGMEAMTINLWVKASSWPAAIKFFSCTETGGFNTESGSSGYLRFPVHVYTNAEKTTTAYKYDSKEIQISALSTTDWNMITYIYSTTGTKTYINGQLHHIYNNTSYGIHFNTNARLFLGCEANVANPTTPYFNGKESDFRLYATALSDEDIKELYETSVSIDNKSNIYSRQFEENDLNKISITNRGQLQMDAIEENSSTASFYKDTKDVKGQLIYEY